MTFEILMVFSFFVFNCQSWSRKVFEVLYFDISRSRNFFHKTLSKLGMVWEKFKCLLHRIKHDSLRCRWTPLPVTRRRPKRTRNHLIWIENFDRCGLLKYYFIYSLKISTRVTVTPKRAYSPKKSTASSFIFKFLITPTVNLIAGAD